MTNFELVSWNNCRVDCINILKPVCNADKTCSPCTINTDCNLAPNNAQTCKTVAGNNVCFDCNYPGGC